MPFILAFLPTKDGELTRRHGDTEFRRRTTAEGRGWTLMESSDDHRSLAFICGSLPFRSTPCLRVSVLIRSHQARTAARHLPAPVAADLATASHWLPVEDGACQSSPPASAPFLVLPV